jgi:hypothetical protein
MGLYFELNHSCDSFTVRGCHCYLCQKSKARAQTSLVHFEAFVESTRKVAVTKSSTSRSESAAVDPVPYRTVVA